MKQELTNPAEVEIECKNLIDAIVNKIIKIFNVEQFRETVGTHLIENYNNGLEEAGIKFQANFVRDDQSVEFLKRYAFQNIEDTTDMISKKLRGELQRAIISKQDIPQIKQRIKNVFKDTDYTNRLKMIIRTETLRANNEGQLTGAVQSGKNLKKWVSVIRDDVSSSVCDRNVPDSIDNLYGSPEKAIPLDKQFKFVLNNRLSYASAPPFHPNCRCVVMFYEVPEREK